jgi:hypothetical protein
MNILAAFIRRLIAAGMLMAAITGLVCLRHTGSFLNSGSAY